MQCRRTTQRRYESANFRSGSKYRLPKKRARPHINNMARAKNCNRPGCCVCVCVWQRLCLGRSQTTVCAVSVCFRSYCRCRRTPFISSARRCLGNTLEYNSAHRAYNIADAFGTSEAQCNPPQHGTHSQTWHIQSIQCAHTNTTL